MTVQNKSRRALIIGGSMAGLYAGLALRKSGWEVDIFERVEAELSGRGAGLATHPEIREALARIDLDPGPDLGVDIVWRKTLAPGGGLAAQLELPQTMTSWDRIYTMLAAKVPRERYHRGLELRRVEQRPSGVVAHFADGGSAEGDVLIGADGIRSSVRAQYQPDVKPHYAGYVAWRGLANEADLSPSVREEIFEAFAFDLPPGEQMLGYPVAGPNEDLRKGHRRYNTVWYRRYDAISELPELLTDERGRRHPISIPPPLIRKRFIEEMRAHAEAVLTPQFRDVVHATAQPFLQPIYDLVSPRLAFGRVAIIGDAAFVARPHVGAGVAKAWLDAIALADALESSSDVETALERFERPRLAFGNLIVARARELGQCLRVEFRDDSERRATERWRRPDVMMKETAVLDFARG